jgi:hypothetical protein
MGVRKNFLGFIPINEIGNFTICDPCCPSAPYSTPSTGIKIDRA